jgi:hypothetical protein
MRSTTHQLPIPHATLSRQQPPSLAFASTNSAPDVLSGASDESGGSRPKSVAEQHVEDDGPTMPKASSSTTSSIPLPAQDSDEAHPMPDSLAGEKDLRGRTGGGSDLNSTAPGAPSRPKVTNASVPGRLSGANSQHLKQQEMSEEQRREVEEHNREFESKHDRAAEASKDKVDTKFWQGKGGREKGQ